MAVAGLVRMREHQFGRQTTFGTNVAAKRSYPFTGVPDNELNWTDPEVDTGSIDPTTPPYRAAPSLTASLTDPALKYNNLPLMLSAVFGDAVTPTGAGTAKTWVYAPASTTADVIDTFTYEFGDDVTTDWFQLGDGFLESLEISGPEGLGVLTASMGWRFGSIASSGSTDSPDSPTVPTSALTVSTTDAMVYLKDGEIAIASDPADFGTSQISDALHSFTLRISKEIDEKRWANGDQSFDVDAYAVTGRTIELECTFAKTTDTVGIGSESDSWMSDDAVNRWAQLTFTSTVEAEAATPYSWVFALPMRYYTRVESEVGGNTVVVLTGRAFYDPTDLPGVFTSTVVNSLAAANF